jgi:hypothetical protein
MMVSFHNTVDMHSNEDSSNHFFNVAPFFSSDELLLFWKSSDEKELDFLSSASARRLTTEAAEGAPPFPDAGHLS